MTAGSSNPFPSVLFAEQSTAPLHPVGGQSRVFMATGSNALYSVDSSGVTHTLSGSGFANPMTTTGDLITSSSGSTPDRIGAGASNSVLTAIGAGVEPIWGTSAYRGVTWTTGTSMPAGPMPNQRITRTDLGSGGIDFVYDGTRWLSTTLYELPIVVADALNGSLTNFSLSVGIPTDFAIYLVKGWISYIVLTTNDVSNYWSMQWASKVAPNNTTNQGSAAVTSGTSPNTYASTSVTMGTALTTSTLQVIVSATKTGSPGNLYMFPVLQYRLIGV